jgi:hypothetical protein
MDATHQIQRIPQRRGCLCVSTKRTGIATLEGTPFVRGQSAPDPVVLRGPKPLRINEVAAIAAYCNAPIQSLWEAAAVILNEHELGVLMSEVAAAKVAFGETYAEIQTAKGVVAEAAENSESAMAACVKAA